MNMYFSLVNNNDKSILSENSEYFFLGKTYF